MQIRDPSGVAAVEPHRVDARIGAVPRVEAEVDHARRQRGEQPLDLVLELDVAAGVRVEDGAQPELERCDGGHRPDAVDERLPAVQLEPARGAGAAGGRDALRRPQVDHDEEPAARGRDGGAGAARDGQDLGQPPALVQRLEDERAGRLQPPALQLGTEHPRILGQVADGAQLEVAEARAPDLVEHLRPGRVRRRSGEVDAPGHRAGREADGHCAVQPPSTSRLAPVTERAAGDAR
jgi:hypothetical protein